MNFKRTERGMTLIEVIIAMAILGVLVIAFSGLLTFGYNFLISSGDKTTATFTAQKTAEEIYTGVSPTTGAVVTTIAGTVRIQLPSGAELVQAGNIQTITATEDDKSSVVSIFVP